MKTRRPSSRKLSEKVADRLMRAPAAGMAARRICSWVAVAACRGWPRPCLPA